MRLPCDVYIHPLRFADIITDSDIEISIFTRQGRLLSYLHNTTDPLLFKKISSGKSNPQFIDNKMVYYVDKSEIKIIAIESMSHVYKRFCSIIAGFLPFGVLTALFIIALVFYYSMRQLSLVGELKNAIKSREFIVHYQPIISTATHKCIGAEALVRWRHSNGKLIRPDLFIPLAIENGLIPAITNEVIECVFSDCTDLLAADPSLHISINVCAKDMQSGRILEFLGSKLAHTGILPNQIWIEVTERGLLELSTARQTITQARALGYLILIDDFGTGYSNLNYLQNLELDILKIDKSFIDNIGSNSATSGVTEHIIKIADELKLQIVAEGVETKTQLEYLELRGVTYIQGYYFSKPIPADAFKEFLVKNASSSMS